eukprot:CAMPEP_0114491208 /NCGR_PEP_ID=MMETSP0109-20121206/2872_1 /TAXON_ID=29199 /ORGANISM="Chlorarachnion reptans, Strain CCCM449" /LENGTH=310 /DNA_ID=CAMNT_0001667915 /DNA_START=71 /DNA_END=1003 /DNA_ORIENTATION=-
MNDEELTSAGVGSMWSAVLYQNMLPSYFASAFTRPLDTIREAGQVMPPEFGASPMTMASLMYSCGGILPFVSGFGTKYFYGIIQGFVKVPCAMFAERLCAYSRRPTEKSADEKTQFRKYAIFSFVEQNLLAIAMHPIENCMSMHLLSCARYSLGQGYEFTSIFNAMKKLVRNVGVFDGLYGGLGMRLLQLNIQMMLGFGSLDSMNLPVIDGRSNGTEDSTWIEAGVALVAATVAYPLSFVLDRMRVGWVVPDSPKYSTSYELVRTTFEREGFGGFYSGLTLFMLQRITLFALCKSWHIFALRVARSSSGT